MKSYFFKLTYIHIYLDVYRELLEAVVDRVVEAQAPVQPADAVQLAPVEIPPGHVQVLRQPPWVVALRDDGHVALGRPAQQHLRRRLAVLVRDGLDGRVVQEQGGVLGPRHVELEEGLRAQGGVGRDGDALALGVLHEARLGEVGVVFDLEGRGRDLGVPEEVHDELAVEVADPDRLGHAVAHQLLHGRPRLLDRGVAGHDLLSVVGEAGRVPVRGVDVLEGDGEVDNVQVEIVDAPVCELLFADRPDPVVVVEGIPELGDEEEVGTFDYPFFDGSRDALAGLLFVAVV